MRDIRIYGRSEICRIRTQGYLYRKHQKCACLRGSERIAVYRDG